MSQTYDVRVEKLIAKPAAEVFKAISQGRLLANCSGDTASMKIDFRVGGKYRVEFKSYGFYQHGEFLEINPYTRISFSWNQRNTQDPSLPPDTKVQIDLEDQGAKTLLKLHHSGFVSKEIADMHNQGWTGGVNDMASEITDGRVNLVRWFKNVPPTQLYEACKKEIKGKILEAVPNQKITLDQTTFEFDTDDEGGSYVTINHLGLATPELQISRRRQWETMTNSLLKSLVM